MATVARIDATAELEDPSVALELAQRQAREGDGEEFARLVEDWHAGRLLVVGIDVAVAFEANGAARRRTRRAAGIWIERDALPSVETQVAEVVPTTLHAIAGELHSEGLDVGADELSRMFVHVELGPRLRAELRSDG